MLRLRWTLWPLAFFAFLAQADSRDPADRLHRTTRDCRFSPIGGEAQAWDLHLMPGSVVKVLEKSLDVPLLMVSFEVYRRRIVGFMDRVCLDPMPMSDMPFTGFMGRGAQPSQLRMWPTLQGVLRENQDPQILAVDQFPLSREAQDYIRSIQRQELNLWKVDSQALIEIDDSEPSKRWEKLQPFLKSTQIENGAILLSYQFMKGDQAALLSKLGSDALLMAYAEIKNAKKPDCRYVQNALRLFYLSQMRLATPDQYLAAYTFKFALPVGLRTEVACLEVWAESEALLSRLEIPVPVSPYEEDQQWRQTWGLMSDAHFQRMNDKSSIKVIRPKGDLSAEKRVISEIPGFGTLEEFERSAGALKEYRWISALADKSQSPSTKDLSRKLKKALRY